MPKTVTPRKPETVSSKLAETRAKSKNRSLSSLLGIGDNEKRLATDFGSGLNDVIGRGTIAGLLGLPGDLGGAAENGLRSLLGLPQVTPYGGSEHIGQKMEQAGLVSSVRRPKTELLASLISPAQAATAGYKAPQMARAGVKALDNLSAPRTMGRQQGAIYNIFHGTTPEAAASIEKNGFDLNKSADGSIWFTSNPEIGEVAASGKGGIVQRSLDDQAMKLGSWDEADKYGVDELLQQGYDGLKLDDGDETVYQIFNPQKLGNGQPVGNLGKMVAPQDEALRVAQANAAKPEGLQIVWDRNSKIGGTSNQAELDYFGFERNMKPSEFRSYVPSGVWNKDTRDFILDAAKRGDSVAPPFLTVDWDSGAKAWKVIRHEGRSRTDAAAMIDPDSDIPVSMIPRGLRAKDITEEMRRAPIIGEEP